MLRSLLVTGIVGLTLAVPSVALAKPAPVTWCGTDEAQANRVPDLEVSDVAQIHVVYAVASDGTDHFSADASGIATDIAWIDQWWQGQDPSRTPRFDRYPFPGCTSKFGQLDLGFVRLPNSQSYYAAEPSPFNRLVGDLPAALHVDTSQKTLVYYDGPIGNPGFCGEGQTDPLTGGADGFAIVYMGSSCDNSVPGQGGSSQVAAHELTHDLGAVQPQAPHMCTQPDEAGHVCDSDADLMNPFYTPGVDLDQVVLDVNHDDYYAHNGTWWDAQDSQWLERLPQAPFTVQSSGSGTLDLVVNRTSHPDCKTGCQYTLDNGASVQLTALPAKGFRFTGWTGGCSGAAARCDLTISAAATVAARFAPLPPKKITIAISGHGTVRSSPPGLACSVSCAHSFGATTAVSLAARPAAGWRFVRWTGAGCGARARCIVGSTQGTVLRARFARR